MALLVARLGKLYTKLETHHHESSEALLSASLQVFRARVSSFLNHNLSKDSKPGPETLSLTWFHKCFEVLHMINKAFASLVLSINHPLSRWEADSMEDYLSYTLFFLQLLNSTTSSLSHLTRARLSLSRALTLAEASPGSATDHLVFKAMPIHHLRFSNDCVHGGDRDKRACSGKELVIHEALMVMKSVGYWVCGVVLSGLSGDPKPYMEMREKAGGFSDSPLADLDSWVCEMVRNRGTMLEEVTEMKEAVACLVDAMVTGDDAIAATNGAEEMRRRLERFEKMVDGLGKKVDDLFSEVLAGRNQLLDGLRPMKL